MRQSLSAMFPFLHPAYLCEFSRSWRTPAKSLSRDSLPLFASLRGQRKTSGRIAFSLAFASLEYGFLDITAGSSVCTLSREKQTASRLEEISSSLERFIDRFSRTRWENRSRYARDLHNARRSAFRARVRFQRALALK